MTMPAFDVIIIGLGAVGSAALYQLSRRGVRVLGIDRFQPPHDRGSSHGDTRITRLALGEGDQYVQFARRSHQIWRELETEIGGNLLCQVGGLIYGLPSGRTEAHGAADFLQTTIDVARKHGISHEVLAGDRLSERFPQFRFRGDEVGCFEHEAGYVHPESCITAQLEGARRHGAQIRTNELFHGFVEDADGIHVTTDQGQYTAGRLILSAGSWLPSLMPPLAPRARIYRQVLYWFEQEGEHADFMPDRFPIFIRVPDAQSGMFYGFPAIDGPGGGLKIAGEQFECSVPPDEIATEVQPEETAAMHDLAAPHLRITSRCVRATVCKYTVTPDSHFVIDHHPDSEKIWFASACSGHGFKHSAAVGEALAEVALEGKTNFDLSPFKLGRFTA